MIEIIEAIGTIEKSDGQAKPGETLFKVTHSASGIASITIQIIETTQIKISSETGCQGGSGDGSSWVTHTLFWQTLPNGTPEELDKIRKDAVKDWNGTCQAIRIFDAGKRYKIWGVQDNIGPTVINTNLIGITQS